MSLIRQKFLKFFKYFETDWEWYDENIYTR